MTTLSPTMPLAQFIREHYLTAAHGNQPKSRSPRTPERYLLIVAVLVEQLERVPLVSDLSQGGLGHFLKRLESDGCTAGTLLSRRSMFVAVWRYAGELGLVHDAPPRAVTGGGTAELSEAEGTLWHLCLTRYFPTNVRIRCEKTKVQYRMAIKNLRDTVGHEPTIADLTEDNLCMMVKGLVAKGKAPKTANERGGRVRALWEWLARRKLIDSFPLFQRIQVPARTPRAWTKEEIVRIFRACDTEGGHVAAIPARIWWTGLLSVLWDSGGRIGEILALRWEWIDLLTGHVHIPAEARKNQQADAYYQLHRDTVQKLLEMQAPLREYVFPWDRNPAMLWKRFKGILVRAGLPTDAKSMFHKIRRSVASHLEAGGVSASRILGHASPETTRKSYLDPAIVASVGPAGVLFRPFDTEAFK